MESNKFNKFKSNLQEKKIILRKRAEMAMNQGVNLQDPDRIDIRGELVCGKNVVIDINVIIEGRVQIGDDVIVGANCILVNSTIGSGSTIHPYSMIEDSVIGERSFVGPYGRVRPNSNLGDDVQVGNFVEIKNANIASGCRINHLAFVGDADLEVGVTLGAGTITCNHDGFGINKLRIEKGAYIGSGCNLVAPLTIHKNATVASGSTITEDVPPDKLTIARSKQVTVKNWKGPKHLRDDKK